MRLVGRARNPGTLGYRPSVASSPLFLYLIRLWGNWEEWGVSGGKGRKWRGVERD